MNFYSKSFLDFGKVRRCFEVHSIFGCPNLLTESRHLILGTVYSNSIYSLSCYPLMWTYSCLTLRLHFAFNQSFQICLRISVTVALTSEVIAENQINSLDLNSSFDLSINDFQLKCALTLAKALATLNWWTKGMDAFHLIILRSQSCLKKTTISSIQPIYQNLGTN